MKSVTIYNQAKDGLLNNFEVTVAFSRRFLIVERFSDQNST